MATRVADLARTYYLAQQATSVTTAKAVATAWSQVDPLALDESWAAIGPRLAVAVGAGQLRAAALAPAYLGAVLEADEVAPAARVAVSPAAFVGYTSAGLPLERALGSAPVRVKQALLGGLRLEEAMARGMYVAGLIARSEVADAGRSAMGVAMDIEAQVIGYERHVNLPACGRCIVLAGRLYSKSAGFPRHPRCDCTHTPVTRAQHFGENLDQTPERLTGRMSRAEQDRAFGKDAAEAIRQGGDISQVVNARSGMSSVGDLYTRSGTTRRASFGKAAAERSGTVRTAGTTNRRAPRVAREPRLSPAGLRRIAAGDEQLYLELLKRNAYVA